jgi:hypothetical protein
MGTQSGRLRILGAGLLILLFGCTTTQNVSRLDGEKPKLVCIVQHSAVRAGVLEVIQEGLRGHGIASLVVPGTYQLKEKMYYPSWTRAQVATCDALLFYVANWNWDLALYMHFANIWMTTPDGVKRLGHATYDASGNIGPGKFIVARDKLLELIDQLVPTSKVQESARKTEAKKADTRMRLEELEGLRTKGLVSEQEYAKKREQIINDL